MDILDRGKCGQECLLCVKGPRGLYSGEEIAKEQQESEGEKGS